MSELILPNKWIDLIKQETQSSKDKKAARRLQLCRKFIKNIEKGLLMTNSSIRKDINKAAKKGKNHIIIPHPLFFGYEEFKEARKEKEYVCSTLDEKYDPLSFSFIYDTSIGWCFTIMW